MQTDELDTVNELADELDGLLQQTNLSEREAQTIVYMAHELERCDTATEAKQVVADAMGIEPSTVDTYYRRALEKFHDAMYTHEAFAELEPRLDYDPDDPVTVDDSDGSLTVECSECGVVEPEYEDMGKHGFALNCPGCGAGLYSG